MVAFEHCKDKEVLLELLKEKPNLNIQNKERMTFPMIAFKYCKDKEVLLEILKQKPNLNIQDRLRLTTFQ
jgi:NCAIR mutase (PurE)-related protein